MTDSQRDLSLAELERLLTSRKMQLEDLEKQRQRLRKELANVDDRIKELVGRRTGGRGAQPGGRRVQNPKSLHKVVLELLGKNKKGFPLGKLTERVLATGYKTHSADFKNVLYQCLYNSKHIQHDPETGHYMLKPKEPESKSKTKKK